MGRLDHWAKVFFQRPEIFAALFNGYLFHGEEVLSATELVPLNTKEVFTSTKNKRTFFERERDLLQKVTCKRGMDCTFLLLGLEAQSFPDASMPVRCMLYDALNYATQLKELQPDQPDNAKAFPPSFSDDIRLAPVITLVLALTDAPWPRTRELHDLLAIPDKKLTPFIPNYRINLITPNTMTEDDIHPYGGELEAVLLTAKNASNRKAFQEVVASHTIFQNIKTDTARLIMEITQLDFHIKDKKENINMTEQMISWEEYFQQKWLTKGREEGLTQGLTQGREEGLTKGREEGLTKGREEGLTKGREEGLTQGREEGLTKGREEGQQKGQRRGTISTLFELGKPPEEVCTWLMGHFSLTEQQAKQEIADFQASRH
ncbi:MAG: Rpn family recombination-promoting nuclease/putative transposase [Victivallales bacterium]|nr:Rpn family recombination-promoting nuclease/putative transposase [Victivallales bacterium]